MLYVFCVLLGFKVGMSDSERRDSVSQSLGSTCDMTCPYVSTYNIPAGDKSSFPIVISGHHSNKFASCDVIFDMYYHGTLSCRQMPMMVSAVQETPVQQTNSFFTMKNNTQMLICDEDEAAESLTYYYGFTRKVFHCVCPLNNCQDIMVLISKDALMAAGSMSICKASIKNVVNGK